MKFTSLLFRFMLRMCHIVIPQTFVEISPGCQVTRVKSLAVRTVARARQA